MEEDTDVLLVMLQSLLTVPVPSQSVLLDALVESNGDVNAAASFINSRKSSVAPRSRFSPEKKRNRPSDLDDWLKTPSKKSGASLQSPIRIKPNSSSNSKKPTSGTGTPNFHASDAPVASSSKMPTTPPPSILSRLRPPPSSKTKSKPKALPPLSLPSPTLVSQHTPCTLHTSILPPELACRLFYTMLDEAKEWKRNKWWLFDRLVESPHRTGFYTRMERDGDGGEEVDEEGGWKEAAQFWYNGRETKAPSQFPAVMEEACTIIERVVNEELRKRPRFPLEWAGYPPDQSRPNGDRDSGILWRANVAASNCYEGAKESVGYHSDSLTYLGPYPTIASLSLGTTRIFRLREVIPSDEINLRQPRTYNIPVTHNSLLIMHASTQEKFKHTVPPQPTIDLFRPPFPRQSPPFASSSSSNPDHQIEPSNCRINITFRFYRPDFHPSTIPRCKCGVPAVLKPDMKNRHSLPTSSSRGENGVEGGRVDRFWWHCNAGAQNEGKDCGFWKVLDMKGEGRGPCVGDVEARVEQENTSI